MFKLKSEIPELNMKVYDSEYYTLKIIELSERTSYLITAKEKMPDIKEVWNEDGVVDNFVCSPNIIYIETLEDMEELFKNIRIAFDVIKYIKENFLCL